MMTKSIPVEKFRASLNFIKVLHKKGGEQPPGGSHMKSQKGKENTVNKADANFYEEAQ